MEGDLSGSPGSGTIILALLSYLGAMLMAGLMTAFFRLSGLYRNRLLEAENIGRPLAGFLESPRHFMVSVSSLYLALTVLGCFTWGGLLAGFWTEPLRVRFYVLLVVTVILAWSLGGLLFKQLAAGTALTYARTLGSLLYPILWLLRPWATALLWVMDRIDDTLWTGEALPHLSPGEIRSMLREENGSVTLEDDEREWIRSIFSFHDTAVREIMVPRIDMVALDSSAPIESVVETVKECHHSRIPMYEGSVDKVTGLLYAKDLLGLVEGERMVTGGKVVGDLARPAYFIPESKKIDEVLEEFRTKRIHMAVVIDEYGGTAGLVTLEDVLEEIVGEIEDEFDQREQLIEWVDEKSLRVDPKIDLEDLQHTLGVELPDEESETLGGLIYEAAGSVPQDGDKLEVAGLKMTVEKVVDQRILQVLISAAEAFPGYSRRER
jgi:CBS domain containing-hemolysin-like protein